MGGLWSEADEANEASLKQIQKEKGKSMTAPLAKKPWHEMSDAEQRADIAERIQKPAQTPTMIYKGGTLYKPCEHNGSKAAFTLYNNSLTIAGAKGFSIKSPPKDTKLIIDLAGLVKLDAGGWLKGTVPENLAHLKIKVIQPPILTLDWPDRQEPNCDPTWWITLVAALRKNYAGGRIIIACAGAHGRTGTAMAAIILAASAKTSVKQAVEMVRKTHCSKAVESHNQINYLREFRPNEDDKWFLNAASDVHKKGGGGSGYLCGFPDD